MAYTNYSKEMEDPYYWRNKVLSWRADKEVNNRDANNPSGVKWTDEISKEKLQEKWKTQSDINKLWYRQGMQLDLNSTEPTAALLISIMNHVKDIEGQEKEDGKDLFPRVTDEKTEVRDDMQERRIKALAVSALAEADGHAPEAKKILDQIANEKHKKTHIDSNSKPSSSQDCGR